MLIVKKPAEAAWTPVLGAEVLFAPITRTMFRRARRDAMVTLGDDTADLEDMGDAFSLAVITAGAQDWRGVCAMADGEDDGPGEELPFTADNLAAALSDPLTFEAFDAAYVHPFIIRERERAAPGNGYAVSPSGTGEAAMAGKTTAGNRAERRKRAATSAPTGSTKPKPTKKRSSGPSL
ncbi:hypothetical protein [Sphingomonas sp.]|uniref:hypothetical protein n=1 Tax=Sphingomonas sp. TaxID=28214 RepID=UPI003AFFBD1D